LPIGGILRGLYHPVIPEPEVAEVAPPARIHGVFYGKYVSDVDGTFRGFIRGVYGRSVHGLGVFRGHYFNAEGEEKGVLKGRWANHPFRPGGPFAGIWFGESLEEQVE
jgi:hypothetical protein